ncbi:MAG: AAA family ATPase [Lachnospiraceae bacterium]|nr:AAA family ATPase [Lachnospiraceae bacterium]
MEMEKQKNLPVGMDDFAKIIEKNLYYVDKTLLAKEICLP